jgi:hypothetical protein
MFDLSPDDTGLLGGLVIVLLMSLVTAAAWWLWR